MKKIYLLIFSIFVFNNLIGQTGRIVPDVEQNKVCWDSAGVQTTLLSKLTWVPGRNQYKQEFINLITGARVIPTIGAVTGGQGSVSPESCGVLALREEMTQDPDTCQCIYELDLENPVFTTSNNSPFVHWQGEKVVTRNCGFGEEEISRQAFVQTQTIKKRNFYVEDPLNATPMVDGAGFIREMRVHLANPTGSELIDLNPNTVLTTYPALTTQFPSFDVNDLIFDAASQTAMETAISEVLIHAMTVYGANNSVAFPSYDPFIDIQPNGTFRIGFAITHNPAGHYLNIDFTAANASFRYSSDGVDDLAGNTSGGFSNGLANQNYQTSCGFIVANYTAQMFTTDDEWKTLSLSAPSQTLVFQNSVTCTEACQSIDDGCISICDTVIVSIAEQCQVEQKFGHQYLAFGTNETYNANTINSITVTVTSGVVSVGLPNRETANIDFAVYTSGQYFNLIADDCKYIMNDIILIGANGTGSILFKY